VKSALPLIIIVVLLGAMLLFTRRNRDRAMAQQARFRERIGFGTEVMTTSGLYGTVTGVNADDSVQLSIAPGVEVKWAVAALRDIESLPNQYRQGMVSGDAPPDDGDDSPGEQPER
jgi:preprotein translocase subunit YajC